MIIYLAKSNRSDKKYMVRVENKTVHFGARGMSDFTIHKDPERKQRYIARHKKRENWTKSGIKSAGFWSLHLLWNKPSLQASIKDIENKFNVKIKKVSTSNFPSKSSVKKSTTKKSRKKSTKKSRKKSTTKKSRKKSPAKKSRRRRKKN